MKIKLLQIGKTKQREIQTLVEDYAKRLSHYVDFQIIDLPDIKKVKHLDENQQKEKEADLFIKNLNSSDWIVLLDENGKTFTSRQFSSFFQTKMNSGTKNLVFIIGGPYGFSDRIYKRSNQKIALSSMTFTHEMVRLFFIEQTYRAYAILNNLPYHHD